MKTTVEKDLALKSNPDFWQMIEERKGEPSVRLEDAMADLLGDKDSLNYQSLYQILLRVIRNRELITYRELSDAYEEATGDRIHWRNWGCYLAEVCRRLGLRQEFPSIAAIVVNGKSRMPGRTFFHLPRVSKGAMKVEWQRILALVYEAKWPKTLPR